MKDVISERDQGSLHLSWKRLSPVVLSLFGSGSGEGSNASFIDLDGSGDADLRGGIISGYSPRAVS